MAKVGLGRNLAKFRRVEHVPNLAKSDQVDHGRNVVELGKVNLAEFDQISLNQTFFPNIT